jgi:hypothetical protein
MVTADSRWGQDLRATIQSADAAIQSIDRIAAYLWDQLTAADCLPRELPEEANSLIREARQRALAMRERARAAFNRYSADPVEALFRHRRLSREQYFLLRAMGLSESDLPTPQSLATETPGLESLPLTNDEGGR